MMSIPAPLTELGVSRELKAALLKLSAALPTIRRHDEERVRQRIHLDSVEWFHAKEPVPYLQTIQEALWQDRRLYLTYHLPFETQVERLVDPYGLVAKASVWYLVCARDGYIRVHRVSHVLAAYLTDESFERPAEFDLASYWKTWCTEVEKNRPRYPVTVRVAPNLISLLPKHFGHGIHAKIKEAEPMEVEGWITLTLPCESLEDARDRILGFGRAMQVLQPQALRDSILDYARQIVSVYGR
jgi:predicted DNA-binding transcriptional regulator YafY